MKMKLSPIILLTITLALTVSCHKAKDEVKVTITDADGNTYANVIIGHQVWMVENLKTTKLNDGTDIANITNQGSWSSANIAGYCWYENNEADNKIPYGALYNLKAVQTGKLCPVGWHVPIMADWIILSTYLGGDLASGSTLKEYGLTHWTSKNDDATNSSGFTGLPGGGRDINGNFGGKGTSGNWWSGTVYSDTYGGMLGLDASSASLFRNNMYRTLGASVRCIKD
jgi:uncharacterized protein (TIGR02145 family)